MNKLPVIFVLLVAIEHVYILILEVFLWEKPRTLKIFRMSPEEAKISKKLAINQGVYNGFLAAGLMYGALHPNIIFGRQLQLFFLSCVIIAAITGSLTAKKSILFIQGLPALIAILLVLFV
jgi:putative membrane protein